MSGGWKKTFDLFVGSLTPDITEDDLTNTFGQFDDFQGLVYKEGNRGDGSMIAFVKYGSEEAMEQALQGSSSMAIKECSPMIRRAIKRENREQGDRGDASGSGGVDKLKKRKPYPPGGKKPQGDIGGGMGGYPGYRQQQQHLGGGGDPGKDLMQPRTYLQQQQQQLPPQHNMKNDNKAKPSFEPVKKQRFMSFGEPLSKEQLMMTHVEGPCMFWGQVLDQAKQSELLAISENLSTICPSSPTVSTQPEISSKIYACKYSEDEMWYRCRVLKHIDSNKSEIQYIDYGNGEVVENSTLHDLPGNLSSPRGHAMKYVLYGLHPNFTDPNSVGFEQGVIKLRELTESKVLDAQVYAGNKGVIPVIVSVDEVDINQEVLNAGFGERRIAKKTGSGYSSGSYTGSTPNKYNKSPSSHMQQQQIAPSYLQQQQQSISPQQIVSPPPPPTSWSPALPNTSLPPPLAVPPIGGGGGGLGMPISNMESSFLSMPPPTLPGHPAATDGSEGLGFGITKDPRGGRSDAMGSIGTWEDHVASPPPPSSSSSSSTSSQQLQQQHNTGPPLPQPMQQMSQQLSQQLLQSQLKHRPAFFPPPTQEQEEQQQQQLQQPASNRNVGTVISPSVQAQIAQQLEAIAKFQQQVNHIQRQYAVLENQAASVEAERNECLVNNAKLKGAILEITRLRDEKERTCTAMMQEIDSINNRVRDVEDCVRKVRRLRRQFPTDHNLSDNIDSALHMLLESPEAVSLSKIAAVTQVQQAEQEYNNAQAAIKGAVSKDNMSDLLSARDAARTVLHERIVDLMAAVNSLPLETRQEELRGAHTALRATHAVFLQPEVKETLPLADVLPVYKQWKTTKGVEFQDVRTETNTCHNELYTALAQIQQQLSLDLTLSDSTSPACSVSLDIILSRLMHKLKSEIKTTDLEKTGDASFITMALKSIIHAIAKEMAEIEQILSLRNTYLELQMDIGQWLDEKPDTEPIKQVRQNIKSLKSKLRHKLADRQDAVENEEPAENLESLKSEISAIRQLLQTEFKQEDELLLELSEQKLNHFPELALQFPDAGIDLVAKYGGLVKSGRSLDHYDIQISPALPSVRLSTYNEKPIILKEYIIDENLGTSKDQFLERLSTYNNVISESLTPINAVFFVQRHAHVQVPYYGSCLSERVKDGPPLTKTEIHSVLLGVLRGLDALHQSSLVHGAVAPHNVFINQHGKGLLAEFEFTKSLKQRSDKPFVSDESLKFSSPETIIRGEILKASDMYNLGLLALWLMFPAQHFPLQANGVPEVTVDPDQFPAELRILLDSNPSGRPNAQQLLYQPYFSPPPRQTSTPSPVLATADREQVTLQLRSKSPILIHKDQTPSPPDSTRKGILKNVSPPLATPASFLSSAPRRDSRETALADHEIQALLQSTHANTDQLLRQLEDSGFKQLEISPLESAVTQSPTEKTTPTTTPTTTPPPLPQSSSSPLPPPSSASSSSSSSAAASPSEEVQNEQEKNESQNEEEEEVEVVEMQEDGENHSGSSSISSLNDSDDIPGLDPIEE